MMELAGSLYLLATYTFAVVATIVGLRLMRLSRRTGQQPEWLLGSGLILAAGLGYGVMIAGVVGNATLRAQGLEPSQPFVVLALVGWLSHNLGVVQLLRFARVVFRPRERWARILPVAASIVLWVGWGIYVYQGGVSSGRPTSGYWCAMTVIGTYPLWAATESFLYYRRMRRRLALGLSDPMVCDRFKLWTIASLTAVSSIWIVNVPALLIGFVAEETLAPLRIVSMLVTAVLGLVTVSFYWLTFFPPSWYERRVRGSVSSEVA
jgi:hypothetical protein